MMSARFAFWELEGTGRRAGQEQPHRGRDTSDVRLDIRDAEVQPVVVRDLQTSGANNAFSDLLRVNIRTRSGW